MHPPWVLSHMYASYKTIIQPTWFTKVLAQGLLPQAHLPLTEEAVHPHS